MKKTDYFISYTIAVFLAFSNLFVYTIDSNKLSLSINHTNRAISIIVFFFIMLMMCFFIKKIAKTKATFFLFLFLFYSLIIICLNISVDSFSTLIRWVSYLLVFCYFSSCVKAELYLKNIVILTTLILSIFTLLLFFNGWYLNINGGYRATSIFGSPVGLAAYLYISSLIIHYFYIRTEISKSIYVIMQILIFTSIILTVTRMTTALLVVSYLCIACYSFKLKFSYISLFFLFIALLCSFAYYILTETTIGVRLGYLLSDGFDEDSSTLFRIFILDQVFSNITYSKLIFGIGLGQFPSWFENISGLSNVAPHFEILWLIIEMGILGGVMYILYLYFIFKKIKVIKDRRIKSTLFFICFSQFLALQLSNPAYFFQIMFFVIAVQGIIFNKYFVWED